MPLIQLQTLINAPVQIVFDLSLSVDLHKASMQPHNEEIVGGVNKGRMKEGDVVIWQARHLFKNRRLKVKLTKLAAPNFFEHEMIEGDFKKMRHEHYFKDQEGGTLMTDGFYFETPFGFIGELVNKFFLTDYMRQLLTKRNNEIKRIAESDLRKQYLTHD